MGDVLTGEALHQRAAELDIDGRSDMTADELRDAVAAAEQKAQLEATGRDQASTPAPPEAETAEAPELCKVPLEKVAEENASAGVVREVPDFEEER